MNSDGIDVARSSTTRRRPKIALWIAGALAMLLGGAGVGWAAATVLAQPADVLDSTTSTYVQVVRGEVGSSISLNTVAAWTPAPIGSNVASGTVTTVNVEAGEEVTTGSILYTVDLRPVVVAQGAVPAFRALSRGSSGTDVAQLQAMLTDLGVYGSDVDGEFGAATQRAVRAWQKSLDIEADGDVQAGDIIFVPALPARLSLDTERVKRGAVLGGGEEVIRGLPTAPAFTIPITASQAGMIPVGTRVEITGPESRPWEGFVVEQVPSTKDDSVSLTLGGKDGTVICGEDCGSIPVSGDVLLRSRVVTLESVSGLVVPSAALLSKADGSLVVVDVGSVEHVVSVISSARGMSVIDGVAEGLRVRVPAERG